MSATLIPFPRAYHEAVSEARRSRHNASIERILDPGRDQYADVQWPKPERAMRLGDLLYWLALVGFVMAAGWGKLWEGW